MVEQSRSAVQLKMQQPNVQKFGDSVDFGDSAEPSEWSRPKRSVSLLTPEQLQRKRAQDREGQRQMRARVKHTITDLEKKVEQLSQELHLTRLENASLQERNQLAPPGTIPAVAPLAPVILPQDFPEGTAAILDVRQKNHPSPFPPMDANFSKSFIIQGQISTEPVGPNLLDPSLFYLFDDFEPPAMSVPVWNVRPLHYPATCRYDKIFFEIVENLRPLNSVGGNALEFSNPQFPHVQALLNPPHHAATFPLTTAIVSRVIYVMTVESLPEQIAVLYVMCCMIRWIITGSEEDYYAMPDWLRPGAAQVVTAHPAWIDTMPWPKSRDRLCRDAQYHDRYEEFKNACNETISINWPYDPTDTLIRINQSDFAINPVFITHIRTVSNWTLGAGFLKKYPDFEHDVNIGKPRTVRR